MKKIFVHLLIILISKIPLLAQDIQDSGIRLTGFIQSSYRYEISKNESPFNEFELNRLRFGFKSKLIENIKGELELEPLDPELIKDAKIQIRLSETFAITFGRFKLPFSLERLTSSRDLPFIDRTKLVREISDLGYAGRDLGIQMSLRRNFGKINFSFNSGIFNGNSNDISRDNNNSKSFVGRLEISYSRKLSIGFNSSQKFDSVSNKYFSANGIDISVQPLKNLLIVSEIITGRKNLDILIGGFYSYVEYKLKQFATGFRYSKYYKNLDESGTNYYDLKIDWLPEKNLNIFFNFLVEEGLKNNQNLVLGISYGF